jgi:hypothetical protein
MAAKRAKRDMALKHLVGFVEAEFDAIMSDRCDEAVDEVREEIRNDNEAIIHKYDLTAVDLDAVLDHPKIRKLFAGHIKSLVDHLTYMNEGEDADAPDAG